LNLDPSPPHHRRSIRLKDYDYSQPGAYFVTLVTQRREEWFGAIQNNQVILTSLGQIVLEEWQRSAEIRKEIRLWEDELVIMPNHVHGIVWIVGMHGNVPRLADNAPEPLARLPHSLSTFISGFKGSVTRRARRECGLAEIWQRNYYEHILRSPAELDQIRAYIQTNPQRWMEDQLRLAAG
jgi:REP element-mobilizing transposase RayT